MTDVKNQKHYTQFKIQPIEFVGVNNLDYFQGNIIKYICRYNLKNGLEDLMKAKHYLDMLIYKVKTGKVSTTAKRTYTNTHRREACLNRKKSQESKSNSKSVPIAGERRKTPRRIVKGAKVTAVYLLNKV